MKKIDISIYNFFSIICFSVVKHVWEIDVISITCFNVPLFTQLTNTFYRSELRFQWTLLVDLATYSSTENLFCNVSWRSWFSLNRTVDKNASETCNAHSFLHHVFIGVQDMWVYNCTFRKPTQFTDYREASLVVSNQYYTRLTQSGHFQRVSSKNVR
jgi:hypothetical protein